MIEIGVLAEKLIEYLKKYDELDDELQKFVTSDCPEKCKMILTERLVDASWKYREAIKTLIKEAAFDMIKCDAHFD
jgi:uncharacterized hydantoinase/oxoprolinase family protein